MINSGLAGVLAALFAVILFHPAFAAAPAPGSVIKDCADCPSFVVIPAGKFVMGAVAGEELGADLKSGAIEQGTPEILEPTSDSLPRHLVTIAQPFARLAKHSIECNPGKAVSLRGCNIYDPKTQDRITLGIAGIHEGYALCVGRPLD